MQNSFTLMREYPSEHRINNLQGECKDKIILKKSGMEHNSNDNNHNVDEKKLIRKMANMRAEKQAPIILSITAIFLINVGKNRHE
jgi:hypothetical protein